LHAETLYFISFTCEIEDSASEEDKDKDNEKMERKHTESKRRQVRYILWKIFISNFNVWLSQNLFVVNKKR
jgi:hypothetical protein